jgi:CheY-like chemotaxis protein
VLLSVPVIEELWFDSKTNVTGRRVRWAVSDKEVSFTPMELVLEQRTAASWRVVAVSKTEPEPLVALRLFSLGVGDVVPMRRKANAHVSAHESPAERFRRWALATHLTASIRVLADTPLEGIARFSQGVLKEASCCGRTGVAALEEILDLGAEPELMAGRPSQRDASVLLVEDDAPTRRSLKVLLETTGYRVVAAPGGFEALELVERFPFDLVVSDIEMPRVDGWALMRTLHNDPQHHELPVVLLTGHEDAAKTLRGQHVGARAYLMKSGQAKELLDTVEILTSPRQRVREGLAKRHTFEVELRAVGGTWLLTTLGELEAQGVLSLEDARHHFEITVGGGKLVGAVATGAHGTTTGLAALKALVPSQAWGTFSPAEVSVRAKAPDLHDMVTRVRRASMDSETAQIRALLRSPRQLVINSTLSALYGPKATAPEKRVLSVLKRRPSTVDAIATGASMEVRRAERILLEFLKRGIVEPSLANPDAEVTSELQPLRPR